MSDKKLAYSAFVAAQKEFSPALKTSTNPHFKNRYADLAACVEAVMTAMNNHGLAVMQRPLLDMTGITIHTVFLHESGEEIDGGTLHVPASKNDAQGYGSAATYCRRYGLMAACGIAPEDDDGNAASKAPARQERPAAPVIDVKPWIASLEATTSLEALKAAFSAAWTATNKNAQVKAAYDRLKIIMEASQ